MTKLASEVSEMDFIEKTGVEVSHCVFATGVTNTQADDELIDYLRTYGDLKMAFTVTDSDSSFYKNLIVEYDTYAALNKLKPLLPYKFESQSKSGLLCEIKLLADELYATATGGSTAIIPAPTVPSTDYLHELKRIAYRCGKPFEEVIKEVMDQISGHLAEVGGNDDDDEDEERQETTIDVLETGQTMSGSTLVSQMPSTSQSVGRSSTGQSADPPLVNTAANPGQRISLSGHDLNPPEVQRVVVEHIVRKDDMSLQSLSPLRLRTFSGRIPKPSNEADYDSWRSHIELLRADPTLSPLHVTRRILESLLPPAADLVKGLGPNSLPIMFTQVLDSAFATVQDGEELFAQFLNTLQDHGERPSSFLQRLQLTLSTVVKRGGIPARDTDKHLLKQFCRGCWDNVVITKLQLEQKKDNPPTFSELLFLLRTEEDRQLAKESLMKKHITSSKHRANLQSQSASSCVCGRTDTSAIDELKQQMVKLQNQMSALLAKKIPASAPDYRQSKSKPKVNVSTRPKPWFCFKCGEDGHIVPACTNLANSSLVEQKRRQLKQKQQAWDAKNSKQLN